MTFDPRSFSRSRVLDRNRGCWQSDWSEGPDRRCDGISDQGLGTMHYRTFGRTGWNVSEVGYGMWGMAGWSGSDDEESLKSLDRAVAARLQLLRHGVGVRRRAQRAAARARRCGATRTRGCTSRRSSRRRTGSGRRRREYALDDVFPPDYIDEYTEKSLANLGVDHDRPAAVSRLERRLGR